MKKLLVAVASIALGLVAFAADPMGSQAKLELGKWCSDYGASKAYAEANNVPILVFWANPGCSQCEKLERACNEADFSEWMQERKIVTVFVYGKDTPDHSTAYKWIRNIEKLGEYPFVAVYWKSNATGEKVESVFVGRTGKMPSKEGSLQQQLMDSVDGLIAGWTPGGDVPIVDPVQPVVDPDPVDPVQPVVDPDPVMYTVTFAVDSAKATYTGSLEQKVEKGKAAKAPEVKAKDGWKFVRWDKSFSKVASDLIVTAEFEEVEPTSEVDLQQVYKKAKKFDALVLTGDSNFGLATISIGKINKTKGTVKISVKVASFAGSSTTASATVKPNADGSIAGTLTFKKLIGALDYELFYDADSGDFKFNAANDEYEISVGDYKLGGAFESEELSFYADFTDEGVELPEGYDFEVNPPSGEPIHVKNGTKFSCDKATSIKVKKEDGEYSIDHDYGKNDDKTNESGLKISYKSSKGTFSGSFKIYASMDDGEKKPKLKSYSAKFSGIVIDQVGSGSFSVKIGKKTYTGTCSFE